MILYENVLYLRITCTRRIIYEAEKSPMGEVLALRGYNTYHYGGHGNTDKYAARNGTSGRGMAVRSYTFNGKWNQSALYQTAHYK